jgi:hypothetical protein
MCPGGTHYIWRPQGDDFRTFLGEFVSRLPQRDVPVEDLLALNCPIIRASFIAAAGVVLATTHDTLPRSTLDFRETQATKVPTR